MNYKGLKNNVELQSWGISFCDPFHLSICINWWAKMIIAVLTVKGKESVAIATKNLWDDRRGACFFTSTLISIVHTLL